MSVRKGGLSKRNLLSKLLIPNKESISRLENFKLREVPGGFVNLTSYEVSSQMAALLSYGPRFLLPQQANVMDYIEDFGQLYRYLEDKYGGIAPTQVFLELFYCHKAELEELFREQTMSMVEVAVLDAARETHDFFRTYHDACVIQSDKGNKTCLILRKDYSMKMQAYIDKCLSTGVYITTTTGVVQAARVAYDSLRVDILMQLDKQQVPEALLRNLVALVSHKAVLPNLYGTVKCHKDGAPMRPICSTTKWLSRPIQQILLHILKSCFDKALCAQNVQRVDDVAREISKIRPNSRYIFVKVDVTNMYGSLNKDKIGKVLRKLLENHQVQAGLPVSTELIERMFHFSMDTSSFVSYEDIVYKQARGLPQGACDSGYLATLYLDTLLQLHNDELFVVHKVQKWWKYMDDVLLMMPAKNVAGFQHTFEMITDLKLEVEYEEDVEGQPISSYGVTKCISFLDLLISRTDTGKLLTSRYTKVTSSERMIHAISSTILSYKINALKGFLLRIFRRTSSHLLVHDLNNFYEQAMHNGYPTTMLGHIYHESIVNEIVTLQSGDCFLQLIPAKIAERIQILRAMLPDCVGFSPDIVQNIRGQHVVISSESRYVFPYRSVSLSHLIQMGCAYGNMQMPVYSRQDQSGLFSRYFANRSMVRLVEGVNADRRVLRVGFTSCITCGQVFIVSGFCNLEHLMESEMGRTTSALYQHQGTNGHVISPILRPLRPIKGIDAAYINTIYAAIFTSIGVSCSDPVVLSKVPIFVRALLGYMQGLGDFSSTPRILSPEVRMFNEDIVIDEGPGDGVDERDNIEVGNEGVLGLGLDENVVISGESREDFPVLQVSDTESDTESDVTIPSRRGSTSPLSLVPSPESSYLGADEEGGN